MGLDLLVLPLSRFLAGQYQGPVEAIAERVGAPKPDNPEDLARERVRRIREDLGRRIAQPLDWTDEGEVALSVQYHYAALQSLRAYAALQDYPLDAQVTLDESHPSLMKIYYQNAPTRYPHLIDHSDCGGFYIPCDFLEPVPCREILDFPVERKTVWDRWFRLAKLHYLAYKTGIWKVLRAGIKEAKEKAKEEAKRIRKLQRESPYPKRKEEPLPKVPRGKSVRDWGTVGSSVRLLHELDSLNERLKIPRDSGQFGSGEKLGPDDDPLGSVKYGWAILHYAAWVSAEKRLPLVFDG